MPHPETSSRKVPALIGQRAFDDAPVVRAMLPGDEAVALDATDEAGRSRRTEVERACDGAHRHGSRDAAGTGAEAGRASGRGPGAAGPPAACPGRRLSRSIATAVSRASASDCSGTAQIVHVGMKYRQRRLSPSRQQGLPALPRCSGVRACSHTSFETNRSCASTRRSRFPMRRRRGRPPPGRTRPAVGTRDSRTIPATMIDGATM